MLLQAINRLFKKKFSDRTNTLHFNQAFSRASRRLKPALECHPLAICRREARWTTDRTDWAGKGGFFKEKSVIIGPIRDLSVAFSDRLLVHSSSSPSHKLSDYGDHEVVGDTQVKQQTMNSNMLLLLAAFVTGAVILAWGLTTRHDTAFDDAYITYRYAANLSQGYGLRYNIDQSVLGTTTPLYAGILGAVGVFGIDVEWASHIISTLFWIIAAWCAIGLLRSNRIAAGGIAAALFIAFQPTALSSLGMETALVVALMLGSGWALYSNRTVLLIVLSAMLVLARPDGALWILLLGLGLWRRRRLFPVRELTGLIIILLPWFIYSYFQYGAILPNSALAKIGQNEMMAVSGETSFIVTLLNHINDRLHLVFLLPFWLFFALGILAITYRYRALWWIPAWLLCYALIYEWLDAANFTWYFVPPIIIINLIIGIGFGSSMNFLHPSGQKRHTRQKLRGGLAIVAAVAVFLALYGQLHLIGDVRSRRSHPPVGKHQEYEQTGRWLAQNASEDSVAAAIEIGIIGYYSEINILDTMGLVSPEMRTHLTGWTDTLVYAITKFWPRYAITLSGTAWEGITGQWWFAENYRSVQRFGNVLIYELQHKPSDEYEYKVTVNAEYETTLVIEELWFVAQQIKKNQPLPVWLRIHTGEIPLNQYQFSLFLRDNQTYERISVQNIWPYQEFSLYPSDRWQVDDTIVVPLSYGAPDDLTPGTYQLGIVTFDAEENEAIKLFSQDIDEIHVGWLRVGSPESYDFSSDTVDILKNQPMWENGVTLSKMAVPALVDNIKVIEIGVEWETTERITKDLTVFVHVVDESGALIAQTDRRPFAGRFPTTSWRIGERLRDKISIELPADIESKDYDLRIGLYDNDGRVLMMNGLSDNVLLNSAISIE